jgi:hypothetical protein
MSTAEVITDVTDFDVAESPPARPIVAQPQRTASAIVTTTPADLLRIAVESGADLDRLEKLMELQERWEAKEAKKAFNVARADFKRNCPPIFKRKSVGYNTKDGDFVGYKHAELSDITDVLGPAMAAYGLTYDWDIRQSPGKVEVDCVVTHVMGHSKKVMMEGPPDSSGKKNVLQQSGSTITYLQRYTLLAASGMSTKGEDDDGGAGADDSADQGSGSAGSGPATPQQYSQESFDKNKASWREIVKSKRKTPAGMIAFIETKGALLTESQRLTIDSWSHENE